MELGGEADREQGRADPSSMTSPPEASSPARGPVRAPARDPAEGAARTPARGKATDPDPALSSTRPTASTRPTLAPPATSQVGSRQAPWQVITANSRLPVTRPSGPRGRRAAVAVPAASIAATATMYQVMAAPRGSAAATSARMPA